MKHIFAKFTKNISGSNRPSIAVIALIGAYVAILSTVCYLKYRHFGYDDFDLAIHTQSLNSILHGSPQTSILGIPFLGNHMVLILYLIAPLYLIFHTPVLLLTIQTIALAAGAWPIYRIAQRELSSRWGLALAAAYLIYSPLIFLNIYEFHPIALASAFILYALMFRQQNRFTPFLSMLLLAMSCQENVSFIAIGFGLAALVERRRWFWSVIPLTVGSLYFAIVVMFIMPRLNHTVNFMTLYAHLGNSLPEVFKNIITHPIHTLGIMTEPRKLGFINQLLLPMAWLPVLSPLSWLPVSLVAAQRLLSNRATEFVIIFHYQAEFIPFVFVSSIYAIRTLQRIPSQITKLLPVAALAIFPLLGFLTSGTIPLMRHHCFPAPSQRPLITAKQNFVRQVEPGAKIAATFEFLAPLSDHAHLYSIHHITTGRYTLSAKPYPIPDDLDIIAIDTNDRLTFSPNTFYRPTDYQRLQILLATGKWKIVAMEESLLALQRSTKNDPRLPLAKTVANIPATVSRAVSQKGTNDLRVVGFDLQPEKSGNFSLLTLYWKTGAKTPVDYDILLKISTGEKVVYQAILSPGSRFWPPQDWPVNSIIRDLHRIPLKLPADDRPAINIMLLPMIWTREL